MSTFEYHTELVLNGRDATREIRTVIDRYADRGYRLHTLVGDPNEYSGVRFILVFEKEIHEPVDGGPR